MIYIKKQKSAKTKKILTPESKQTYGGITVCKYKFRSFAGGVTKFQEL